MTAKLKNISKTNMIIIIVAALLLAQLIPAMISRVSAATLGNTFVRFDNMTASGTTTGTVCAEPGSTSSTVASVQVTFPTGFTVSTTTSNWTTNTTNTNTAQWPTTGGTPTAWPNIGATATSVSGQTVTFTSGNLTSTSNLYCFNWTNAAALTQPATAGANETGSITTQTSAPAAIDTGSYATSTISNDQINVTGTVSPTFSMTTATSSGTANTDPLGTLSTSSVSSSSATSFTVNTNAKNGWTAWVKDANSGLKSTSANYTISATTSPGITVGGVSKPAAAITAGTEAMNLGITYGQTGGNCNGTPVVNGFTDGSSGSPAGTGGSINTTYQPIVNCNGSTNTGVITPYNYASINGATPAATDYSDTETFVAAGIF